MAIPSKKIWPGYKATRQEGWRNSCSSKTALEFLCLQSQISADDRATIERLYSADMALYKYFRSKLQQRTREFGKNRMKIAVEQLGELASYAQTKCDVRKVQTSGRFTNDHTTWTSISRWLKAKTEMLFLVRNESIYVVDTKGRNLSDTIRVGSCQIVRIGWNVCLG